jgi:hypothetical protein
MLVTQTMTLQMKRVGLAAVLIVTTGAACGDDDSAGSGTHFRICDASSDIRLAFTYEVDVGQTLPYTSTLYELGSDFLYVDGGCHYWLQEPSSIVDGYGVWRPYHDGNLTSALERELHDLVGYDDFSAGPVAHSCSNVVAIHQSPARLWDGRAHHICSSALDVPADWPLRTELWNAGTSLAAALRIQVGNTIIGPNATVYEWPLDLSPEEYLIEYGDTKSFVVDDLDAAAALRSLRDRAIAEATVAPGLFVGFIPVALAGSTVDRQNCYVLSMRDDVPFTDAQGMWSPP